VADSTIPAHVGLILDGNRRWARQRGLPTLQGHNQGFEAFMRIAPRFFERGVKYLSAFVFSTENWKRTDEEVGYLMDIFLRLATNRVTAVKKRGYKLLFLGRRGDLNAKLQKALNDAETATREGKNGTIGICLNYSSKVEITDAVKATIKDGIQADEVTPATVAAHLYAPEIPNIDMVVRTAGQKRLSNFMLWRAAYAELLFLDKYWPDMEETDVDFILDEFAKRSRRFGV